MGALAERLCVQHHTAVALVDKPEARDLLARARGAEDKRQVLLRLRLTVRQSSTDFPLFISSRCRWLVQRW